MGGLGGVIIIHWPPQSGMVKIDAPLISQILGSILEVWGEPIIPCAVSVGNIIIINTDTEQNILQRKGKGLCCWSGDGVCREWRWSFAGGPESRQQHKPIYSDVCKYLSQWQIYIWVASFTRFCNSEMSKRNKDCLFGSLFSA